MEQVNVIVQVAIILLEHLIADYFMFLALFAEGQEEYIRNLDGAQYL